MSKEKFKRTIQPGTIKPGQCIYGADEIGLIFSHYGQDSEIYKAMASGENVSGLIAKSIEKHLKEIQEEKRLLEMCQKREDLVEQSSQQL